MNFLDRITYLIYVIGILFGMRTLAIQVFDEFNNYNYWYLKYFFQIIFNIFWHAIKKCFLFIIILNVHHISICDSPDLHLHPK